MSTLNDSSDSTDQSFLAQYKLKNLENLIVETLGINSIRNKFDQLMSDLSNKSISGPQPGEAGSIYAVGDFG